MSVMYVTYVCMYVCIFLVAMYTVIVQRTLPLHHPCTTVGDPAVRRPSPDPCLAYP